MTQAKSIGTSLLNVVDWLLTPPTDSQKRETAQLHDLGTSESIVDRRVWAPLKSIPAISTAVVDFVLCPVREFGVAFTNVLDGHPIQAVKIIAGGVSVSGRSMIQVVVIVLTVVAGFFFPHAMYNALPIVRTDEAIKLLKSQKENQELTQKQQQLTRENEVLETKITGNRKILTGLEDLVKEVSQGSKKFIEPIITNTLKPLIDMVELEATTAEIQTITNIPPDQIGAIGAIEGESLSTLAKKVLLLKQAEYISRQDAATIAEVQKVLAIQNEELEKFDGSSLNSLARNLLQLKKDLNQSTQDSLQLKSGFDLKVAELAEIQQVFAFSDVELQTLVKDSLKTPTANGLLALRKAELDSRQTVNMLDEVRQVVDVDPKNIALFDKDSLRVSIAGEILGRFVENAEIKKVIGLEDDELEAFIDASLKSDNAKAVLAAKKQMTLLAAEKTNFDGLKTFLQLDLATLTNEMLELYRPAYGKDPVWGYVFGFYELSVMLSVENDENIRDIQSFQEKLPNDLLARFKALLLQKESAQKEKEVAENKSQRKSDEASDLSEENEDLKKQLEEFKALQAKETQKLTKEIEALKNLPNLV